MRWLLLFALVVGCSGHQAEPVKATPVAAKSEPLAEIYSRIDSADFQPEGCRMTRDVLAIIGKQGKYAAYVSLRESEQLWLCRIYANFEYKSASPAERENIAQGFFQAMKSPRQPDTCSTPLFVMQSEEESAKALRPDRSLPWPVSETQQVLDKYGTP